MSANRAEKSASRAEGNCVMSNTVEAAALMRRIAEPYPAGDKIKAAIQRAQRRISEELHRAGFTRMGYGRAKRIWKAEARRIDGFELDAMRRAAQEERVALGKAHAEVVTSIARYSAMREAFAQTDAAFFGPEIARLGNLIERLRNGIDDGGASC